MSHIEKVTAVIQIRDGVVTMSVLSKDLGKVAHFDVRADNVFGSVRVEIPDCPALITRVAEDAVATRSSAPIKKTWEKESSFVPTKEPAVAEGSEAIQESEKPGEVQDGGKAERRQSRRADKGKPAEGAKT